MSKHGFFKRLESFFIGKGFALVLVLCAACIGTAAFLASSNARALRKAETSGVTLEKTPPKSVTVTPALPPLVTEAPEIAEEESEELVPASTESYTPPTFYVWPVVGSVERGYSIEALSYDVTMRDWRTHDGIDISAALGETVIAAHAGTVERVENTSLYGTVVTVADSEGVRTIYSNLADCPAVAVGDYVEPGSVIGSVGATALCEIGQGTHLHFAMRYNGQSLDPMHYLPC